MYDAHEYKIIIIYSCFTKLQMSENIYSSLIIIRLVLQVTDRTHIFLLEVVRKRPQDSARHHAVVHPLSPSVGRDGGLPSGGHLFPPAGHLLELHQSNVSRSVSLSLFFLRFISLAASSSFRIIIFYHTGRFRVLREPILRRRPTWTL